MIKAIKLNKQEKYSYVDEKDYENLKQFTWGLDKNKYQQYARTCFKNYGKKIRLHQMIVGEIPKNYVIDHIDGDGLNNTRSNLRIVRRNINGLNSERAHNYYKEGDKFVVSVAYTIDNKKKTICGGRFSDEKEAKFHAQKIKKILIKKLVKVLEYKDHKFYKL